MSFFAVSRAWLSRFKPARSRLPLRERFYSALGGLIGLLATGLVMRTWLGSSEHVPLLIAPLGASTVLVFGVPASPLAQPWSVVAGNFIAAVVGVTLARAVPDLTLAAALAVALTIALTSLFRCLHPPAGAVALTAVIGGSVVTSAGYRFALVPVLLNSLLLVGVGLIFNALARRSYPHVPALPVSSHRTADAPPEFRVGFTESDIAAAVERLGTPLDVEHGDLVALFRHVEEAAHRRLRGEIFCSEIMSRDLITISPNDSSELAVQRLREHALRVLPIVDEHGVLHGVLDFATAAGAAPQKIRDLPSISFELARPDTPISRLFPLLSRSHVREALVVDTESRLLGIITQTDLLAIVGRVQLARA
ncbi:MAG TPA: HPP family protein [Polyangiaceae bacterium]|nr:HPP family protein [Polyangiaceae bacterium]